MKKRIIYLVMPLFLSFLWGQSNSFEISYDALKMGDELKNTGKMLQEKPMGFHRVKFENTNLDTVFIAVHGHSSNGYEWVYALQKMAESTHQTFYYRWDWNNCPGPASKELKLAIDSLISNETGIKHIIVFGHSYGGVIVSNLADDHFNITMDIHSLAAPLAGHTRLEINCPDYPRFDHLVLTNNLFQWRTVHRQDGAFKNIEVNPQLIDIKGSEVFQLPSTFSNGKRLGHNRSISWVMNQYFKTDK